MENILYLGGPNIASEIYNKEYANARICGAEKWRKPLAKFLRQPHFIVWDNSDLVTHEVMGGLKNVYAIGAGKLLINCYNFTCKVKLAVIISSCFGLCNVVNFTSWFTPYFTHRFYNLRKIQKAVSVTDNQTILTFKYGTYEVLNSISNNMHHQS